MADAAKKKEGGDEIPTAEKAYSSPEPQKPILLFAIAGLNMLAMIAVGFILWKSHQAEKATPQMKDIEHGTTIEEKKEKDTDELVGKLVPLERFTVNLAGTRGNKVAQVEMSLEVDGESVELELEKRMPQMRDIIIILLSSKTYDQMTSKEGKVLLREEIANQVNSFLTKGKIKKVYFTNFIVN